MFEFLKKKKILKEEDKKAAGTFAVLPIVPESKSLTECLGITNERALELTKEAMGAYHSSSNLCEAMSKASLVCVHANELFFTGHILSDVHQKHQSANAMMSMLGGGLFGGKGGKKE